METDIKLDLSPAQGGILQKLRRKIASSGCGVTFVPPFMTMRMYMDGRLVSVTATIIGIDDGQDEPKQREQ